MLWDLPHGQSRFPCLVIDIPKSTVAGTIFLWYLTLVTPPDIDVVPRFHGHVVNMAGLQRTLIGNVSRKWKTQHISYHSLNLSIIVSYNVGPLGYQVGLSPS